ncbi:MAG: GTPase HflX [Spirochaetales bacterium]|nr:GTPase HflX [Spirochaetales bacterium]
MKNKKDEAAGLFSNMINMAFLVGIKLDDESRDDAEYSVLELERLVETMGIETVGTEIFPVRKRNAALFIGKGNSEEIKQLAENYKADCIIFDHDLTPAQQRNWEAYTNICVLDRQEVIIDIFAGRAQTREAKLQVELAKLEYKLPRIKSAWSHLSRQKGGNKGTRDAGEKQIELDKRIVVARIAKLKKELEKVRNSRTNMRKQRVQIPLPTCSIIGYTNAGKSSLLNNLAKADIFAEDKLFATLDPTTKSVKLGNGTELLMTDTVGFIQKLPHNLVDAFKSTLEETLFADFLLILIDISDPWFELHIQTTENVINEIGAGDTRKLYVFNKIDAISCEELAEIKETYPDFSYISAKSGVGIAELKTTLENTLAESYENETFCFNYNQQKELIEIKKEGIIENEEYTEDGIVLKASVPKRIIGKYKDLIKK